MGHRPYPNADRARRQVGRGRLRWVEPTAGGTPWLLNVDRTFSTVRLPVVTVSPGRAVLPGGISVEVEDGSVPVEEAVRQGVVTLMDRGVL
jgi:hypothetical protein